MDDKINSKFSPSSRLHSVRGLLSTGLLEGVEVIYKTEGAEDGLHGIIKGLGYLCGCSSCGYQTVLSALMFENHAGAITNNQNNHVFFKSGKTIYRLFKEFQGSYLGSLGGVIEQQIGCRPNMKCFRAWKGSFQSTSPCSSILAKRVHQLLSDDNHPEHPSSIKNPGVESRDNGLALKISRRAEPFSGSEDFIPSTPNAKIDYSKVNREFSLNSLLHNVKGLLSTGLLEGVRVIYMKDSKKFLHGIIKDFGYQCGCPLCDYRKVLPARVFEKHAKATTPNPNDHVFFKSGITIYGLVKKLYNSPLGSLGEVIKEIIGCQANMELFEAWKGSFQTTRHGLQKTSVIGVKDLRINPKPHRVKRNNDWYRLIFMENGLLDESKLAYCSKGKIVITGFKFGNGIVCGCCGYKVSPSQFEAHAGYAELRQPYHHIYTPDGVSLHKLSTSLLKRTIRSEDLCTICKGKGDTIPCYGCPKVFHTDCLKTQCYLECKWYCPYCQHILGFRTDASDIPSSSDRPATLPLVRIYKAPMDVLGGCILCEGSTFNPEVFIAKTTVICRQCEKEFHVSCLENRGLCDLKGYPGKWFCNPNCDIIHAALLRLVSHGPMIVRKSLLRILRRKSKGKGLTNEPGVEVQWQLLSGFYQPSELLFSKVVAIFQDSFYPIVERGHDLIPDMINGRDVAGQNYEGMYCAVLMVRSPAPHIEPVVLSAGILRIFGEDVAELPLVATPPESQGKGYFQTLLSLIEGFLTRLKVKVLMLSVADNEQSMWINKFGFVKMTEERLRNYGMRHPLLMFEKTTILEKSVPISLEKV